MMNMRMSKTRYMINHSLTLLAMLLVAGCQTLPEKAPEKQPPMAFPSPPEPARFYHERTLLSTSAVKQADKEDKLRAFLTGEGSDQGEGFAKPFDVAVHQGRVFITDTVTRQVIVMDFVTGKTFNIGTAGDEGDLTKPLGIAVDRSGTVYVADNGAKIVKVYDRDGNYQRSIGNRELLQRPAGVDVDPEGNRLFVVDVGGVQSQRHVIQVFDARSGELVRTIGGRGTGEGEFNLPRDVKLGPDGLLYVTDGGNFRIQVLTQEGEFVRAWGKPGARLGQFSRPKGISIDKQGNVYAVDAAFGNFQIFNPQGQLLLFVGARSTTPGPAKYMLPAGIDVDEDGRVYLVGQFFRKVDIYRPATLPPDKGFLGNAAE